MSKDKMTTGRFTGGLPFARLGTGNHRLVILIGGPGPMPSGFGLSLYTTPYRRAIADFIIFVMGRKAGMPPGYTTRDMAADCAAAIDKEIGAPVDIVGTSYGGLLAPYIAADHPELVDHLVLDGVAFRVSDQGKAVDLRFAELQSRGKWGEALATEVTGMYPAGWRHYIFPPLARLAASLNRHHAVNVADVLIEAQAEYNHDCRGILKDIKAPTLIIAGDKDCFSPVPLLRETAALIPNSNLIIVEGKGHGAVASARFGREIIAFLLRD